MTEPFTKTYRPGAFVPSTSYTGEEAPLLLNGENMWIRFGRFGSVYAEGYTGNYDYGEAVDTQVLTGTITWDSSTREVVGQAGVAQFTEEIRKGQYVYGFGGAGKNQIFCVEKVIDDEHFIATEAPTASEANKVAYIMPVVFPIGTDRGTAVSGRVIQYFKGHYLGVGQGEFKINGTGLNAAMQLDKKARFALYDATTDTYLQDDVGIDLPGATPLITLAAVTPGTATQMRAGGYNIRVVARNTQTLGYSNPSAVINPVTLTAGQAIQITFNDAMEADQDAWDIYGTPFQDNATTTIEARYMGPWYLVKTVKAADLIDGGHPTGKETGTTHTFFYSDAEIIAIDKLLSFNNFHPEDAEWVDMVNGIPIYFSCLGKSRLTRLDGTSPGPVAIPSKPSNPEAVFLNRAFTTAGNDTIMGVLNVKSRIFCPCENSLQVVILTTLDVEPVAFRSLWNVGFRNPFNVDAAKEYIYGFSTSGIVRSVAGGDDTAMEFEFSSDVKNYIASWNCGKVLCARDPKNNAMIFFLSGAEYRDGYLVSIALPFMLDRGVFNPPIILKKTNTDFVVCAAATIGNDLVFLAGGRTGDNVMLVQTYGFDGGDQEAKAWNLCWAYTDDGKDFTAKKIKGFTVTGRFSSANTALKLYGVSPNGEFEFDDFFDGANANGSRTIGTIANLSRRRYEATDFSPYPLYGLRLEGSYSGDSRTEVDRFDELALDMEINSSKN